MKKIVAVFAPILIGLLIFIFLLSFSLKNTHLVDLNYYLGFVWRAPLYLIVLSALFSGVVISLLTCLVPIIKQRQSLTKLRAELNALKPDAQHFN